MGLLVNKFQLIESEKYITLCNVVSICFSSLVSSAVGLLVEDTAKLEYLDNSELVWFSNETACDLIDEKEDIEIENL